MTTIQRSLSTTQAERALAMVVVINHMVVDVTRVMSAFGVIPSNFV